MASYLITGASRGIGLALTEILAGKPATDVSIVFAAARTETDSVKTLIAKHAGRIELIPIDVTSADAVKKAATKVEQSLGGKGLDVLINNAGIMNHTPKGVQTM
jgi:NAD(P)-dependent dehydrogenase (short-subunit alcohol dehydrogenase family)